MKCHLDHTVYELFDKRSFRCDCGTPRSNVTCQFELPGDSSDDGTPGRSSDNRKNSYSHNFDGLYCWCYKPYDHESDVTMFQCLRCQDWFHEECIKERTQGNVMPAEENFSDFFCAGCIVACDYLLNYPHLRVYGLPSGAKIEKKEEKPENEKEGNEKGGENGIPVTGGKRKRDASDQSGPEQVKKEEKDEEESEEKNIKEEKEAEEASVKEKECKLNSGTSSLVVIHVLPNLFFPQVTEKLPLTMPSGVLSGERACARAQAVKTSMRKLGAAFY